MVYLTVYVLRGAGARVWRGASARSGCLVETELPAAGSRAGRRAPLPSGSPSLRLPEPGCSVVLREGAALPSVSASEKTAAENPSQTEDSAAAGNTGSVPNYYPELYPVFYCPVLSQMQIRQHRLTLCENVIRCCVFGIGKRKGLNTCK